MTTILLISLAACYLVQKLLDGFPKTVDWVPDYLSLSAPGLAHGKIYQLITFQFLHGSFMHLLMNMIALYFFGRAMEEMLGSLGMLRLYLISGAIGGLLQCGLDFAFHAFGFLPQAVWTATVGASAGIFGLVAAFATRVPDQPITILVFFFLPVTFKARVLLIIEACITVAGIVGPLLPRSGLGQSSIAHGAHLGGMLTGIAWIKFGMLTRPSFNFWRRRPARRESTRTSSKRSSRSSSRKSEEMPPAEFISREVDPILEKISAHGIHSLTERERQILEAARSKMAKR